MITFNQFFKIRVTVITVMATLFCFSSCNDPLEEDIPIQEEVINRPNDLSIPLAASSSQGAAYDWLVNTGEKHWKVQYAIGSGSNDYRESGRYYRRNNTGSYLHQMSNTFSRFRASGSNLRFEVRYGDDATSSTGKPRTELREMTRYSNGKERNAGWSTSTSRTFKAKIKIDRLDSDAKRVAVAQYFSAKRANGTGNSDDIVKILVIRKSSSKAEIIMEESGLTSGNVVLDDNYSLSGKPWFNVEIRTRKSGSNDQVEIKYTKGSYTKYTGYKNLTSSYKTDRSYFKCGAYMSSSSSTGGTAVVLINDIDLSNTQPYDDGY